MSVSKKNQPTSPLHHIVPLWRNWDYLLLWSGQAISSIGSQLSQFALPLFVLALTGSPVWAGVAGGLRTIPYLFLSLPAGALVGRCNRKWIMPVCDIVRATFRASIPIAALTAAP